MNISTKGVLLCLLGHLATNQCMEAVEQKERSYQFVRGFTAAMSVVGVWERYGSLIVMAKQLEEQADPAQMEKLITAVRHMMVARGAHLLVYRIFCAEVASIIRNMEEAWCDQTICAPLQSTADALKKLVTVVQQSSEYARDSSALSNFVDYVRMPRRADNSDEGEHRARQRREAFCLSFSSF